MRRGDHIAPALGSGLGFLLAGLLFLLQELDLLDVGWAVLPALLVVVGAATALAGVAGARRAARTRR